MPPATHRIHRPNQGPQTLHFLRVPNLESLHAADLIAFAGTRLTNGRRSYLVDITPAIRLELTAHQIDAFCVAAALPYYRQHGQWPPRFVPPLQPEPPRE